MQKIFPSEAFTTAAPPVQQCPSSGRTRSTSNSRDPSGSEKSSTCRHSPSFDIRKRRLAPNSQRGGLTRRLGQSQLEEIWESKGSHRQPFTGARRAGKP